ncbi:hypothetical protein EON65_05845, partial [archaeon]
MEKSQLAGVLDSLRQFPIESHVVDASLAQLWFNIWSTASSVLDKANRSPNSADVFRQLDQVHDVLQVAKRLVLKITSTNDLVETILKRSKITEEIAAVHEQLDKARSDSYGLFRKSVSAVYTSYVMTCDVYDSVDLLVQLKDAIQTHPDDSLLDYVQTIDSLIAHCNAQRPPLPP